MSAINAIEPEANSPNGTGAASADDFAAADTGNTANTSFKRFTKEKAPPPKDEKAPPPEWDEELLGPKPRKMWSGVEGITIMLFGVCVPLFLFMLCCGSLAKRLTLVMLNHPVETLIELTLIGAAPIINYQIWSALCKHRLKFTRFSAGALGMAMFSGLFVSVVSAAGIFAANSKYFSLADAEAFTGLSWLSGFALVSCGVSFYLMNAIRASRELSATKKHITSWSSAGILLALALFAGAEARPWLVRTAAHAAVSSNKKEARQGLLWIRELNPEHELHMECADTKAAGLPGLFMPIKQSSLHQLYFQLTGKPYSFHETNKVDLAAMPDDYLSHNIVGEEVSGLTLARSTISANLHALSSSAAVHWTFVLKNDTSQAQDARAELQLPQGAVVDNLTAWKGAEKADASFARNDRAETSNSGGQGNSPVTMNDLGRGRVLLECAPILQDQEFKVDVSMVVPLKPDTPTTSSMLLPRVLASNFDLDGDSKINVTSDQSFKVSGKVSGKEITTNEVTPGLFTAGDFLTPSDLRSPQLELDVTRKPSTQSVAVLDLNAMKMAQQAEISRVQNLRRLQAQSDQNREPVYVMVDGTRDVKSQMASVDEAFAARKRHKPIAVRTMGPRYVVETLARVAEAQPKQLLVVIDGSETTQAYRNDIAEGLKKLPTGMPTRVVLVSSEDADSSHISLSTEEAVKKLTQKNARFLGGSDNLNAVVNAAELAGQTTNGAVMWIHGPQPVLNQEIYIMSPYTARPSFYELALGTGDTDTATLFKNHPEIGPFSPVPHGTTNVGRDLASFFDRWQKNGSTYAIELSETTTVPTDMANLSPAEQHELLTLNASRMVHEFIAHKNWYRAATVATRYSFLSPITNGHVDSARFSAEQDTQQVTIAARNGLDADRVFGFVLSPVREHVRAQLAQSFNKTVSQLNALNSYSSASAGQGTAMNGATYSVANASTGTEAPAPSDQTGDNGATETNGDAFANNAAPSLEGATNGTIGPQGADATLVYGVNTAGTVRVNNLANLEAWLNILANLGEVGMLIGGGIVVLLGITQGPAVVDVLGQKLEISKPKRVAIGVAMITFGLMVPGMINWFVASARDANLFS